MGDSKGNRGGDDEFERTFGGKVKTPMRDGVDTLSSVLFIEMVALLMRTILADRSTRSKPSSTCGSALSGEIIRVRFRTMVCN